MKLKCIVIVYDEHYKRLGMLSKNKLELDTWYSMVQAT